MRPRAAAAAHFVFLQEAGILVSCAITFPLKFVVGEVNNHESPVGNISRHNVLFRRTMMAPKDPLISLGFINPPETSTQIKQAIPLAWQNAASPKTGFCAYLPEASCRGFVDMSAARRTPRHGMATRALTRDIHAAWMPHHLRGAPPSRPGLGRCSCSGPRRRSHPCRGCPAGRR